jgi:hypothetical protein
MQKLTANITAVSSRKYLKIGRIDQIDDHYFQREHSPSFDRCLIVYDN